MLNGIVTLKESRVHQMLTIELPCDPAIPLLDMYTILIKYAYPKTWIWILIRTLFTITKKLKQSSHPSNDKCGTYSYRKNYSATKRVYLYTLPLG
jgi:hypothetical protein